MQHSTVAQLNRAYGILVRLYPRSHYERFGEPMQQTFADMLHENVKTRRGSFVFILWTFIDTLISIVGEHMGSLTKQNVLRWHLVWSFLVSVLLMTPLVAMQLAAEMSWDYQRIGFMGFLLLGAWFMYGFLSQKSESMEYRAGVAITVFALLTLCWVGASVGILGDNGYLNAMYLLMVLTGAIAAIAFHYQPKGMAYATLAMAAVQVLLSTVALTVLRTEIPQEKQFFGATGQTGVFLISGIFVSLFVVSACLFWVTAINDRRRSSTLTATP